MTKLILILVAASRLHGQTIGWTSLALPSTPSTYPTGSSLAGQVQGYQTGVFDPVSGKTLVPSCAAGIYVCQFWQFDPNNKFGGSGATAIWDNGAHNVGGTVNCVNSTATSPGNGHIDLQLAVDTYRHLMWSAGRYYSQCGATLATINGNSFTITGATPSQQWYLPTDAFGWQYGILAGGNTQGVVFGAYSAGVNPADDHHATLTNNAGHGLDCTNCGIYFTTGSEANPRQDTYYMTLNTNPLTNVWSAQHPAQFPFNANGTMSLSSLTYDPEDDLIVAIGGPDINNRPVFYFCPTNPVGGGTATGTLTSAQVASGRCTSPDTWILGVPNTVVGFSQVQRGWYDDITHKIILFGGGSAGLGSPMPNKVYAYDVRTQTLTQKCTLCTIPDSLSSNANAGYNHANWIYRTVNHHFYWHQYSGTGSPADYEYDPVGDTFTLLAHTGSPSTSNYNWSTYDSTRDLWILSAGQSGGGTEFWQGTFPSAGAITDLDVSEALFPGDATGTVYGASNQNTGGGIARSNEPVCQGVPIADSQAITSIGSLGLGGGVSAGQFRILSSWPSGHAKWIKTCAILTALAAGGTDTITLTSTGSGNFGGSNLATDNGATITVATGTGTFTIKKANFNGLDIVDVGATHVVLTSSSANRGLVLLGPSNPTTYPDNVTCGSGSGQSPCTRVYSSANDPASTCAIEENGPVIAVIRCIGNLMDATSHAYLQYTVRENFYKNGTRVKVVPVLRNANYDTAHLPSNDYLGATFNTAYKGMQSLEWRIDANISGTINYNMATDTTPVTGTLSGSDTLYIYQAQSSNFILGGTGCDYQSSCANKYTMDIGYVAKKNATTVASGDQTKIIGGWLDCYNSSGVGIQTGVYQMTGFWPKSLECNGGGADIRIGLFPSENSQAVYQPWQGWTVNDVMMNFHATALGSPSNDFLKYQQYLVMRPDTTTYINNTNAFPYPLSNPTVEDATMVAIGSTANPSIAPSRFCYGGSSTINCTPDLGTITPNLPMAMYKEFAWSAGGGYNQREARWSDLQRFFQRGQTGRYLNSLHFYRYQMQINIMHSDGGATGDATVNSFLWSDRPGVYAYLKIGCAGTGTCTPELNGYGYAQANSNSANNTLADLNYPDALHDHWHGMFDYYMMTGDELVKEANVPRKAYYKNYETTQAQSYATHSGYGTNYYSPGTIANGLGYTRAAGIEMINAGAYGEYLDSIGDSDAAAVKFQGEIQYNAAVDIQGCLSGFPSGCTTPSVGTPANSDPYAMSFERGVHQSARGGAGWCATADNGIQSGLNGNYRVAASYQNSILAEGLLYLRRGEGSSWGGYSRALDMAYGLSQWALEENYQDDGNSTWNPGNSLYNGYRYSGVIDLANVCPVGTYNPIVSGGTLVNIVVASNVATATLSAPPSFGGNTPGYSWQVVGSTTSALNGNYVLQGGSSGATLVFNTSGVANGTYNNSTLGMLYGSTGSMQKITDSHGTFIYDADSVAAAIAGAWFPFYVNYLTNGSGGLTAWQRKWNFAWDYYAQYSSGWASDFGTYDPNAVISTLNAPTALALQDISFTCLNCSGGNTNYQLQFTTPASTCTTPILSSAGNCLRIKWSNKIIANSGGASGIMPSAPGGLLGYESMYTAPGPGAFTLNPSTYNTWFAANNITDPTPTPGVQQTITVSTGTTGLVAANFSVKSMFNANCAILPTTLGPYTIGQVVSQTFTNVGCNVNSWNSTGTFPTGLTFNTGAGTLTGTVGGSPGTFTPSIMYDTATNPYSIVVNAAPIITTSSPLPSGTVGIAYSQTLVASPTGTTPDVWTITSGTQPTGLTLSTSGILSGTPSTTSGSPFTFTVRVTDNNGVFYDKVFTTSIGSGIQGTGGSRSGAIRK